MKHKTALCTPLSLTLVLSFLVFFHLSCSTGSSKKSLPSNDASSGENGSANSHAELKESSIDIEYSLGRDQYRLYMVAQSHSVTAQSFRSQKLFKSGTIDQNRYPEFLKKASAVIHSPPPPPSEDIPCRGPYTLTVKIEKSSHTIRGCRSTDDGTLSKLINDGEFLLYSKN